MPLRAYNNVYRRTRPLSCAEKSELMRDVLQFDWREDPGRQWHSCTACIIGSCEVTASHHRHANEVAYFELNLWSEAFHDRWL